MKAIFLYFFFFVFTVNLLYAQEIFFNQKETTTLNNKKPQESSDNLKALTEELDINIKKLLFNLTHEETSKEKQLEIIKVLGQTALVSEDIEIALKELIERGSDCKNVKAQKECLFLDLVSLKAQVELIRRQTESLTSQDQNEWDYYKDIALDGLLVITGVGFLFIPVGGPVLSMTLFTIRFASLGKWTAGSIVTGVGSYRMSRNLIGEEDEELKTVFEFVQGTVAINLLTRAIFHFAQLGDEELLERIVLSSSEEDLMNLFYSVIEDDSLSNETRRVAVETLLAFPEEMQIRRTRITKLLVGLVDKDAMELDISVRVSAVEVLGRIGERVPEVAEYLLEKGQEQPVETNFLLETNKRNIEDELRLIILVQSGRNKVYFNQSIEELKKLITERRSEGNQGFPNNLEVELEIPEVFVKNLLLVREENIKSSILVLKEFIQLKSLDVETKLKLSDILIEWVRESEINEEIKRFLKEIWENPVEDIGLYVEQLEEKNPTEENKPAFNFLQARIRFIVNIESSDILSEIVKNWIQSIFQDFEKNYPNQREVSEKVRVFIEEYSEIQEFVQN